MTGIPALFFISKVERSSESSQHLHLGSFSEEEWGVCRLESYGRVEGVAELKDGKIGLCVGGERTGRKRKIVIGM